jgi:hypothetical protein
LAITLSPGGSSVRGRRRIRLNEVAALDDQEGELESLVPFHEVLLANQLRHVIENLGNVAV